MSRRGYHEKHKLAAVAHRFGSRLCKYEIEDDGFSLYTLTEEEPSAEDPMTYRERLILELTA